MRIGRSRSPDRFSYGEAEVASEGLLAAEKIRDGGVAKLGGIVLQATKLRGDIAGAAAEMARLDNQPVNGIHDEPLTVSEAERRQKAIDAQIKREAAEGSLKHRRVPRWLLRLVMLAPIVDLPLLTLFASDMLNTSWDEVAQGRSLLPAITSVSFGLMGTVVIALSLHAPGFELRGSKDDQGQAVIPKGRAG